MMATSMPMTSRFLAVSERVSPFCTDDPEGAIETVSADIYLAASSNDVLVLVDAS